MNLRCLKYHKQHPYGYKECEQVRTNPYPNTRLRMDRGSGNIMYNELSGMWRNQSDRLVCNQHYVMH